MGILLLMAGLAVLILNLSELTHPVRHISEVGVPLCLAAGAAVFVVIGSLFVVRAVTLHPDADSFEAASGRLLQELKLLDVADQPPSAGFLDRVRPTVWRNICGYVFCVTGFSVVFACGTFLPVWAVSVLCP